METKPETGTGGPDRRAFLTSAGKFAVVVPPAMTLLLSTSMNSAAIAASGMSGGTGGTGGTGGSGTTSVSGGSTSTTTTTRSRFRSR